jgi:hypothetical protein
MLPLLLLLLLRWRICAQAGCACSTRQRGCAACYSGTRHGSCRLLLLLLRWHICA